MSLMLKPGTSWTETYARCLAIAPEAFDQDRVRNRGAGTWQREGEPGPGSSPIDGGAIVGPPMLGAAAAEQAVKAAMVQHRAWRDVALPERKARVTGALDALIEHRELLAMLLVWEIGKPWKTACADVDRCIHGARWHVEECDGMLAGRGPLDGPVRITPTRHYPPRAHVHPMRVAC